MSLTTADIIEAIVDELGGAWRFRLDVTEAPA